jgi:hypothetical protein
MPLSGFTYDDADCDHYTALETPSVGFLPVASRRPYAHLHLPGPKSNSLSSDT